MKVKYKKGYKYQLAEDYHIQLSIFGIGVKSDYIKLDANGHLLIRKGYAWDGPSGPMIDTKTSMRGSLVHDAIYQLIREGHLPKSYRNYADYMLKVIFFQDGMNKLRVLTAYWAVKYFAAYAADPKNKRAVVIAP